MKAMGNPIHTESNCELLRGRAQVSPRAEWWKAVPLTGAAFFILLTLLTPNMIRAQSGGAASTAHPAAKPESHARTSRRHAASHSGKPAAAARAVPAPPPAPAKPDWPIDQPPNPAKVTWDSQGLAIQASNSSLKQILQEVSTDTGVKIQGMNQDERVFGTYGPGPAREILSSLLEGSGYNMLMIGGQGDNPPQQIILSKSASGTPQPVNAGEALRSNSSEEDNDTEEQPQEPEPNPPMPIRSPFPNGMPPRTPQQIQQEMIMRQQQMEQQQQQNQPR